MLYFKTFLWSLTYPVTLLVGQIVGYFVGRLLYFFYTEIWDLNLSEFISAIGPMLVSGLIGGLLSGLLITKYARKIHFPTLLIIPTLLTALVLFGNMYAFSRDEDLRALFANAGQTVIAFAIFIGMVKNRVTVSSKD